MHRLVGSGSKAVGVQRVRGVGLRRDVHRCVGHSVHCKRRRSACGHIAIHGGGFDHQLVRGLANLFNIRFTQSQFPHRSDAGHSITGQCQLLAIHLKYQDRILRGGARQRHTPGSLGVVDGIDDGHHRRFGWVEGGQRDGLGCQGCEVTRPVLGFNDQGHTTLKRLQLRVAELGCPVLALLVHGNRNALDLQGHYRARFGRTADAHPVGCISDGHHRVAARHPCNGINRHRRGHGVNVLGDQHRTGMGQRVTCLVGQS